MNSEGLSRTETEVTLIAVMRLDCPLVEIRELACYRQLALLPAMEVAPVSSNFPLGKDDRCRSFDSRSTGLRGLKNPSAL